MRRSLSIVLLLFALLSFSAKAFGILHALEDCARVKAAQHHCCESDQEDEKSHHEKHHHQDCCSSCQVPAAIPFTHEKLSNFFEVKKSLREDENLSPPEEPDFSPDIPPVITM